MVQRRSLSVMASYENPEANRCVDIFVRADGTWGFEEYRRDPEDGGTWTRTGSFGHAIYGDRDAALHAAASRIEWLEKPRDREGD
jgi:hypothetical protein